MPKESATEKQWWSTRQENTAGIENERFLVEIESQFHSPRIAKAIGWRLRLLREISTIPELDDVFQCLYQKLTQVFSARTDETTILTKLKKITEIELPNGSLVDIRHFARQPKQVLNEKQYRLRLGKKITNTSFQLDTFKLAFPETTPEMNQLKQEVDALGQLLKKSAESIGIIRQKEEQLRLSSSFTFYQKLKVRFLREWLQRFSQIPEEELLSMPLEKIHTLVLTEQRYHMTQLLKSNVRESHLDMSEHLGLHDTLEASFSDRAFWGKANSSVCHSFRQWVLTVIESFGLLKKQRYAFFELEGDSQIYLLFGVGLGRFPGNINAPLEMIPYVKPFVNKEGYLLEVRNRQMDNPENYYFNLRHYLLPFLFAFDNIKSFSINKELISYFTSSY